MSQICGNCGFFRPQVEGKFFNCTSARHAGLGYGMQVRADTGACEAFCIFSPESLPEAGTESVTERQQPVKLCPWVRTILVASIVIAVLLLSWVLYTCASTMISAPAPTPSPTPAPGTPSPTPTPIPTPVINYLETDATGWAIGQDRMVLVHTPERITSFEWGVFRTTETAPAGTVFIRVKVTYVNSGARNAGVSANDFVLRDSTGVTYTVQNQYYHTDFIYNGVVQAGKTGDGEILWVVPSFANGLQLRYVLEPSSMPQVVVIWQLPW